jgi:hypothetical protein
MIQVLDAKRPPLTGRGERIARVIAAAIENDELLAAFERVLLEKSFHEANHQRDVGVTQPADVAVDRVD